MAVDLNQLEITVAQLEEDATVIGKIVNDAVDAPNAGEADGTVTTRLGDVVKNVNRVLADLTASNPVADLSGATTTDLAEGTNLYYTDEKVDDRVSSLLVAGDGITLAYDDGANTLTVDAAIPAITTISTSRALALTDASDILEINTSGGGVIVTIPTNATVPFPIGTVINFTLVDITATATLQAAAGVTLNGVATGGGDFNGVLWDVVSMYKRGTDEWVASGDIGAIA